MPKSAARSIERMPSWPLTREAWDRLIEDVAQLRAELVAMTGQGLEEGIVRLAVAVGARRLATLKEVLDRCEVVDEAKRAVIGRRVVLRDGDGEALHYRIGFPGDGDPDRGFISADSPLGMAVLGTRPGDVVRVEAPAGPWTVTVVTVD
jgi:transcription elongation factor GreA